MQNSESTIGTYIMNDRESLITITLINACRAPDVIDHKHALEALHLS
jgi:hypothetical protein